MRQQGKISKWDDEHGFGFISSSKGSSSLYVHISSFPRSRRRPSLNEGVSYTLGFDAHGRPQASDVWFIAGVSSFQRMRQIPRSDVVQIVFAVSFLIALAVLVVLGWLEVSWLVLYYVSSIITYGCYARDKKAAERGDWRTSESKLQLMSLIGGWPGALIAQMRLRHKTRKPSFLVQYWFNVIVNCVVLGVIVWRGVSPLKALLDAWAP